MFYEEVMADLFSYKDEPDVYFAQCVSADLAMGKGIAVQFNEYFDIKNKAKKKFGTSLLENWDMYFPAECVLVDNVFLLVTKRNYWNKPTKSTIAQSLMGLENLCVKYGVRHLVMPKIASGLDKRPWEETSSQIKSLLGNLNMRITVCVR